VPSCSLSLSPSPLPVVGAESLVGKVVRVVDGDTAVVLDADKVQHRVRLEGVDAAERGQPFGKRSTENLTRPLALQEVRVDWCKRDRWDRLIGKVWVASPDAPCAPPCPKTLVAGLAQITSSLAWPLTRCRLQFRDEYG
jgi:endonuclease YncB( thermonuclease family)